MGIEYRFLNEGYVNTIHTCWMRSFADYQVDMSYMSVERMVSRAKMDRVDFNYSVGAFNGDEMVGFLLIGIDTYGQQLSAFDAGTGIIPELRGQGIAGALFDFIFPRLKEKGVKQILLEVIQDNQHAIRAYTKKGFEVSRSFNCYKINSGDFKSSSDILQDVIIKQIDLNELEKHQHFLDWDLTWEYTCSAMHKIQDNMLILGAYKNKSCIGLIAYNKMLNWIFVLAIHPEYRDHKVGSVLLSHLFSIVDAEVIKFNNIPEDHRMCHFMKNHHFEVYIKQFEMVMYLF